jgi:hypothetical protein
MPHPIQRLLDAFVTRDIVQRHAGYDTIERFMEALRKVAHITCPKVYLDTLLPGMSGSGLELRLGEVGRRNVPSQLRERDCLFSSPARTIEHRATICRA